MNKELNSQLTIVLATLNGADFLAEQLDSLIAQTETQWNLLIRDDGSTDDTLEIIRRYAQNDKRIQLLSDEHGSTGSASGNFSILMESALTSGAEYVFFCDQDDVWVPDKLALTLAHLLELEGDEKTACLVHHDLMVTDTNLETIADSFIKFMRIHPGNESSPQRLISRNEVTGCAMACNRALLEISLPVSDQAVMHDWWLALCAGFFGRLAFMPQRLVKYRQHKQNTIGAKSVWHSLNPLTNWIKGWHRGNDEFDSTIIQARAFRVLLAKRLGENSADDATLKMYIDLPSASRWQRLKSLRQCGWRSYWLLNVVLVLRVLLLPRESV